jgi:REP element-mobilizing transposase RayT
MYHVMNRGDRREDIFQDDEDRERALSTLGEACRKTGWQVHGYCLMRNHFHLVIETPQANLVAGMPRAVCHDARKGRYTGSHWSKPVAPPLHSTRAALRGLHLGIRFPA